MSIFVRNVITLGLGNLIAQLISVAAVPLITRLYTPEEYGIFTVYLAVSMAIFPIASLQFDTAAILPRKEEDGFILIVSSMIAVCIFSLLFVPLCLLGITTFGFLQDAQVRIYLWFLPIGIFILGVKQVMLNWALRGKRFKAMTYSAVSESIVDRGFVLVAGALSQIGALGLILGRILGPTAYVLSLMRTGTSKSRSRPSLSEFRGLCVRYRNFPLFATWGVLMSSVSREVPMLLLAWIFSPTVAGLYGLSVRVMNMPMMMLGDAVAKVFRQRVAENVAEGKPIDSETLRLFASLVSIVVPPVIVLAWFGREIFGLVFGEIWADGGIYAQILIFSFMGMFLHRVLSVLFDILERQKARLGFDLAMLIARAGGIFFGTLLWDSPYGALSGLLFSTVIVFGASYSYLFKAACISFQDVGEVLGIRVIISVPLIAGCWAVKEYLANQIVYQAIGVTLILIIQAVLMIVTDRGLNILFSRVANKV